MAKSFMYEGSEEAFTDMANYMSDRVINGDFSDYDPEDERIYEKRIVRKRGKV